MLKVEETAALWLEESARSGTPVTSYDHVEPMQWRHLNVFNKTLWVETDKINRRKGHNYLTVFADLIAKRVLIATLGKDSSVREAFAVELLRHNGHPKAIQHVTI